MIRTYIQFITLFFLLVFGLFACNNNDAPVSEKATKKEQKSKDSSQKEDGISIALFDNDSLIEKYKYSKDIEEKIRRKERSILANREAKMKDFEDYYKTLNQQAPTMTQNEMMQAEQQLVQRQQQLDSEEQETQRKYIDWKTQILVNYQDHLDSLLESYRSENDIDVLVPSGGGITKFYYAPTYDITEDVIEYLNLQYAKRKEKGEK